jgi:hypothetical protein
MDQYDNDMEYVTRRELREELTPVHAVLRTIVERLDAFGAELRALRAEFRAELGALGAEFRAELEGVRVDLAGQIRSSAEEMRDWIRPWFDKFSDVHPRLDALEAGASPPTRRPPRRAAKKQALRQGRSR